MKKPYLLSLDLGTSSIGYALFDIDDKEQPVALRDIGVRIFPNGRDPKSKEPLAVARRMARGIRRNRDRGQNRVRRLVRELIECGLLPEDEETRRDVFNKIDPYAARAKAANQSVDAHTLGRALFHIGRRRGFKSNRLAGDSEESDYKKKIASLREKLGDQTLGEYLHAKNESNRVLREKGCPVEQQVVRFRNGETDFYADRAMYADEWERIQQTQGNTLLTDEQWEMLRETAFFQYPLKPVPKGKCRFYPDEPRAASGLPAAQRFRIYQEVNMLRYESQGESSWLDERQRLALYDYLDHNKSISFKSIPKRLKDEHGSPLFPTDAQFNLDIGSRSNKLFGNEVMCDLRKPERLGKLADTLDDDKLNELIAFLINPVAQDAEGREIVMEDDQVKEGIRERVPQLQDEQVERLAKMRFKRNTMAVSLKFMKQINPVLKETGLVFSDAVKELGERLGTDLHHSHFSHVERDELPYYGEVLVDSVWGDHSEVDERKPEEERDNDAFEYGKIANPTVHVALNQLRVVVNRIIKKQGGKPAKIHLELTRDLKNSKKARQEIEKRINANKKNKDRIRKELAELGIERPSRDDFQKYILWEELGKEGARVTIFMGQTISARQLFNGDVEIEHIIPFSRCYDDGMANKTLAFKNENNIKGNNTPAEVGKFNQADMQKRALIAFGQGRKYDRFLPGAFDKFYGKDSGTILERELNDTRYISRTAARYLSCLFSDNVAKVAPVNGRLTAVLRDVWNLNRYKDKEAGNYREDHRHHIVDAFVVGLTSRRLVQQLSAQRDFKRQTEKDLYHFLKARVTDIPELRDQLYEKQEYVIASYKPDHTHNGSMFNDTAYGIAEIDGQIYGFTRKAVTSLSRSEVFQICGNAHRAQLVQNLCQGVTDKQGLSGFALANHLLNDLDAPKASKALGKVVKDKVLEERLKAFSAETGIKKVRIRVPNNSIKRIESAPFKGYAKNSYAYCDVWQIPHKKDKKTGKWQYKYQGIFVPYSDVKEHRDNPDAPQFRPLSKHPKTKEMVPHPAAKKLMRLFKSDNIRLTDVTTGETSVWRVAGFDSLKNKFDIQPNLLANPKGQNHKSINAVFQSNHVEKLRM